MKKISLVFVLCLCAILSFAQDRYTALETQLKGLAQYDVAGLKETVDISVSGTDLQEFIRGIAIANKLNINVDPTLKINVSNNFTNESVINILVFLCKQYDLDIKFTGSIMSITKYMAPEAVKMVVRKEIHVGFASPNLLSLDVNNDSLIAVCKKIASMSGINVVASSKVANKKVTLYVKDMEFEKALNQLAFANDLKLVLNKDSVYQLEEKDPEPKFSNTRGNTARDKNGRGSSSRGRNRQASGAPTDMAFEIIGEDSSGVSHFNISVIDGPISDILKQVAYELDVDYFLYSDITGNATLNVSEVNFDNFLQQLLVSSDYTYKKDDLLYLIGERSIEKLRSTHVFQLDHRSVEDITDFIPAEMKDGVDIQIFNELNSLIMSGSEPNIREIEAFLFAIDKEVPVITIDIMIVDVNTSSAMSSGLKIGRGKNESATEGATFAPGYTDTYSAKNINNLLSVLKGFSPIKLGIVSPDFYINMRLLESNNNLEIKSTPRLSTLNGHEATMTIGATTYYQETQRTISSNQSYNENLTVNWKPLNADMNVTLLPNVSGDDNVTLDIKVEITDFDGVPVDGAPPGTTTRQFESMIRVKNNEMIMLGGMERAMKSAGGSGLPFVQRVPVIRWFFGTRERNKKDSKLVIFIKPTII